LASTSKRSLDRSQVACWIVHRRQVLVLLALVCATVLTYANSFSNGFHYDEWHGIVRNPAIKDLQNIPRYFVDPSTFSLSHPDDWRPILQISYASNFYFGGLNPTNSRIVNLLVHAEVLRALGTAIVLLIWVWKLRKSESSLQFLHFGFF
jgi:hypothetical protein